MPYKMVFQVDGACRSNGTPYASGASAAVLLRRNRTVSKIWTEVLPSWCTSTNQRAEITAIILALRAAIQLDRDLDIRARLDVVIETDSQYAVGCMTRWMGKWRQNGWVNSKGCEVANRDLLEEAIGLEDDLLELGEVVYRWIPRRENREADRCCNEALDEEKYYN
jgi:ribonuclease HI